MRWQSFLSCVFCLKNPLRRRLLFSRGSQNHRSQMGSCMEYCVNAYREDVVPVRMQVHWSHRRCNIWQTYWPSLTFMFTWESIIKGIDLLNISALQRKWQDSLILINLSFSNYFTSLKQLRAFSLQSHLCISSRVTKWTCRVCIVVGRTCYGTSRHREPKHDKSSSSETVSSSASCSSIQAVCIVGGSKILRNTWTQAHRNSLLGSPGNLWDKRSITSWGVSTNSPRPQVVLTVQVRVSTRTIRIVSLTRRLNKKVRT